MKKKLNGVLHTSAATITLWCTRQDGSCFSHTNYGRYSQGGLIRCSAMYEANYLFNSCSRVAFEILFRSYRYLLSSWTRYKLFLFQPLQQSETDSEFILVDFKVHLYSLQGQWPPTWYIPVFTQGARGLGVHLDWTPTRTYLNVLLTSTTGVFVQSMFIHHKQPV